MSLSQCFSATQPRRRLEATRFEEQGERIEFKSTKLYLAHSVMIPDLGHVGINGSICGTCESVEEVLEFIQSDKRLKGLRQVESPVSPEEEAIHHGHSSSSPLAAGENAPFRWDHVRVKLKKEIVSLGMPSVSPVERVGKYVSPKDWNMLISDPDTVVMDVRNDYETRIGKFKGAVDPCTTAFREFPSWVDDQFQLAETEAQVKLDDLDGSRGPSFETSRNEGAISGCNVLHGWDSMSGSSECSCPYCYSSKSEEEKERARARQRQFESCGVIGGPDKGRRPARPTDDGVQGITGLSKSL
ncbi:rhodanese/cell cycle control phosphatase superfamily protein [Actinidia rufa]|uniref:Rhodanese/cell cycle control phosphatase superfamily protein n=1 Tax=Actinidia rufa TaxID=165716 RepID=A0A7J0EAV7_9ERIC|nr:rhodanese/cell cycle control phosphatase superfamily protein [Actinidia rufa]